MSSSTVVSNMALSHLGHGTEIADLDSDNSKEAKACRRFYDVARDEMLREFVWPFATKVLTLALVSEKDSDDTGDIHPTDEWYYAYRYPADCLMLRKIQSSIRNDNRQTRIPYRLIADDVGSLILTDEQDAVLEYTSTVGQNPSRWQADFILALSFRIAAYIAPRITGGDPFKIANTVRAMHQMSVGKAKANALNEEQDEDIPDGELIRARY